MLVFTMLFSSKGFYSSSLIIWLLLTDGRSKQMTFLPEQLPCLLPTDLSEIKSSYFYYTYLVFKLLTYVKCSDHSFPISLLTIPWGQVYLPQRVPHVLLHIAIAQLSSYWQIPSEAEQIRGIIKDIWILIFWSATSATPHFPCQILIEILKP